MSYKFPGIPDIVESENRRALESIKEILDTLMYFRRSAALSAYAAVLRGDLPELYNILDRTVAELVTGGWKFGSADNHTLFESDGTLRMVGGATAFEDLQVSISNVKLPASSAPASRLYNHGIGGGITFPVLGFAVNDYLYFDVQSTHSMKISTVLDHHIHYMTPTDGTGKKFKFMLDVIAAAVAGAWAVPTGSPFYAEVSMTADLSTKHMFVKVADIPAVNTTVSTLYKCRLTRVAASVPADEYAGEVYLEFTDCHYEKDTMGSRTETAK